MQDGITDEFYTLMLRLQVTRSFLETLSKVGILNVDEVRVIYSNLHYTCINILKKS